MAESGIIQLRQDTEVFGGGKNGIRNNFNCIGRKIISGSMFVWQIESIEKPGMQENIGIKNPKHIYILQFSNSE